MPVQHVRPWGSSKRRHPRLKHTLEEDGRVLSGDGEVENGQRSDGVHQQTGNDCDHVQTKLLSRSSQVLDVQDFPSDETHNPKWRIPASYTANKYRFHVKIKKVYIFTQDYHISGYRLIANERGWLRSDVNN